MNRTKFKKRLLTSIIILSALFLISAALIVADGLTDDVEKVDVAIVPGNKIESDGTPSARLRARLDKTVELYERGLFPAVIVSGGVGVEGFDEAAVMKAYLIGKGVPEDSVLVDSGGTTTYLTARNSARIMRTQGWRSSMVISQYFHLSRTKLALRRFGVSPVRGAHANYFELRDLYSIAREVFGYGAYLVQSYD